MLYRSESWVFTDAIMKVLEGFHHWIARRITGKTAWRVGEEVWECPPAEEALEAAGLWPMKEYEGRRKTTIEYYIATLPMYELWTGVKQKQGSSRIQVCIHIKIRQGP